MYNALLYLHSILRWAILILLMICIVQSFSAKTNSSFARGLKKSSLFLLIVAHITFLIGLYQWFAGNLGFKMIREAGFGTIMKNSVSRYWVIEHFIGMLIGIILITIARRKVKDQAFGATSWLYIIALIIILVTIPWP